MNTTRTPARRAGMLLAALGAAGLGLTACGDDDATTTAGPAIEIIDAWARTSPTEATAGAAYLTIINTGDTDDALVSVAVDDTIAGTVELHETRTAGTEDTSMGGTDMTTAPMGSAAPMMEMVPVDRIEVAAGGTTSLEPGGYHVMLLEMAEPLTAGAEIELTLTFEHAGEIVVDAVVGDAAP